MLREQMIAAKIAQPVLLMEPKIGLKLLKKN